MANAGNKKLGIGDRIMNTIGDALTPKPTIESPIPVKKQQPVAPGSVASPDQSVKSVKTRKQMLEEIK